MCQVITFRHLQHRGGRCAELESMHVAPDLRGHGVGGVLLEAAVEAARAAGCYRVQLTSDAARADAHRFYARTDSPRATWASSGPSTRRGLSRAPAGSAPGQERGEQPGPVVGGRPPGLGQRPRALEEEVEVALPRVADGPVDLQRHPGRLRGASEA